MSSRLSPSTRSQLTGCSCSEENVMAAIQRTRISSSVVGIIRLWLLVFVPFVVLPFLFLSGKVVPYTALWGHAVFHLIYLPIAAAGWWAVWRFVAEPSHLALSATAGLMP